MTHRISKGGSFKIDRRFHGVGRIALASGTSDRQVFRKFNVMLTELYEDGHLDVLRGIKEHKWTIQEMYQARKTGRLSYVAFELSLGRNLWTTVREWLPRSAPSEGTRKRYGVSFNALQRSGVLGLSATVSDLRTVDWHRLKGEWEGSPADWNRLRAAVSRLATMLLGDKYHPFRRELMTLFPRAKEPGGRVPDLSVGLFWKIVSATPDHVQPAYIALAATGLRVGEYLALEDHHLLPTVRAIRVPGTKTASSDDTVLVGDEVWIWVRRAVPSPVRYKSLETCL